MNKQEFENEKLLIVASAKIFSDQSTYLLGLMKHQAKQDFNRAIMAVDHFTETIEKALTPDDTEKLMKIVTAFNDGLAEMRIELNSSNRTTV